MVELAIFCLVVPVPPVLFGVYLWGRHDEAREWAAGVHGTAYREPRTHDGRAYYVVNPTEWDILRAGYRPAPAPEPAPETYYRG